MHRRLLILATVALATSVALLAGGCAGVGEAGQLAANDPHQQLESIRLAGEQRDASAVPRLVEALESDDPVTRMMAIQALEKITGTRLEYNPYAPRPQRDEAIARWVQAVRSGRINDRPLAQGP